MAEARRVPDAAIAITLGAYAALVALAPGATKLVLAALLVLIPGTWWMVASPVRWIMVFFAAALLLPPLPIALGDAGPHPSVLIITLGLVAGALRIREWDLRPRALSAALLVYFLALLASVAMAALRSGPAIGLASLVRLLLFAFAIYVFFYTAHGPGRGSREIPAVRTLLGIAIASAVFACADFYWQFPAPAGFGAQYVWLTTGVYRRAQGLFYEASTLGNFCAFFLVMIAVALVRPREERPVPARVLIPAGVVFTTALMFSFSRASVVNVVVAAALLLIVNRGRVRLRRATSILLIGASAVASVGYFVPAISEMYWGRLRGTVEFFSQSMAMVLSGRAETWSTVAGFLLSHPTYALLGVGYKTLPYSSVLGHPVVVDNMYLSVLAEAGVAGLAALVLLNGMILRASYRAMRSGDASRSFYGTWMFCFWAGEVVQMLSGDLLTYWRVLPVYFWVLGLAVREP